MKALPGTVKCKADRNGWITFLGLFGYLILRLIVVLTKRLSDRFPVSRFQQQSRVFLFDSHTQTGVVWSQKAVKSRN